MLVMDHSITRKIRFPAFSSLPPLQVVRKYLIFGLVGANLFARSGVIMEALLWASMIVYERWDFRGRVRYIMLENSSIMLLSVTQKNLVLCPKLCSKNIALCSPDFYCIQHVLITTV